MKAIHNIETKTLSKEELIHWVKRWKLLNKKIVFTNGVFDLLHEGHLASLSQAASLGDKLIVAINSDASVKRLKGANRPIQNEVTRSLILSHLLITDAVVIFNEDTPKELISEILPDILVKGGDYKIEEIAGAREVIENGGQVILAKMINGISTTKIIQQLASK
jgi:D-beta-D-heptose 7-phosphate kinase/D-beta-D-heptose 1-phosphate adenosyltransferase